MATKKNNQTATTKDINYYKKKFWRVFAYTLLGILAFFLFASWGLFGSMPSFEYLENPEDRKSTRLNSSHSDRSRMPSSA